MEIFNPSPIVKKNYLFRTSDGIQLLDYYLTFIMKKNRGLKTRLCPVCEFLMLHEK